MLRFEPDFWESGPAAGQAGSFQRRGAMDRDSISRGAREARNDEWSRVERTSVAMNLHTGGGVSDEPDGVLVLRRRQRRQHAIAFGVVHCQLDACRTVGLQVVVARAEPDMAVVLQSPVCRLRLHCPLPSRVFVAY